MSLSIQELRKIIREQVSEFDPDMPGQPEQDVSMSRATTKTRLATDSVDDQIDSFIIRFEEASIASADEVIMESLMGLSLSALIAEQDEGGEEEEVSPPTGSENVTVDKPVEVVPKPPLNIDAFSKRVARLALGYRVQLDVPTVIVNRALNFLKDNYDKAHVVKMKEVLETQFDFNIDPPRDPVGPEGGGRPAALGAFGEPEGLPATGGGD